MSESQRQIAFYVKGRPQGADIWNLVRDYRRVFIGYPPFRAGAAWDRHSVQSCVLDIGVPDNDWRPEEIESTWYGKYRREISRNRNMARLVAPSSMVVVPRPAEGYCYLGKVVAPYELEDDPFWADEYLTLRRENGLDYIDEKIHVADVVQGWRVERWEPIPYPLIPRWIQYQTMGQRTLGEIHSRPDGRRPLDVLEALYGGQRPVLSPTHDQKEIMGRLLDWVGPDAFEHLICDLLQRDQPGVRWWHTGGSGDGGTDGIGTDLQGNLVGVLQCKWLLMEKPDGIAADLLKRVQAVWGSQAKVYIATLFPKVSLQTGSPNVEVIGPEEVARLLWKHRACSSMAQNLQIG